jgi:hypothetical protein
MRPGDKMLAQKIESALKKLNEEFELPGIAELGNKETFIRQIIDSWRRVKYVEVIKNKNLTSLCADPNNIAFDPIKAASFYRQNSNYEEACWLVFLSTHFGKNLRSKWNLVKSIYGKLGEKNHWSWKNIIGNTNEFCHWLENNQSALKQTGSFGNHRKYESLCGSKKNIGTGATISSYVNWVKEQRDHSHLFAENFKMNDSDPKESFDSLYKSMDQVKRFGRTAKFDYLCMIGKLELAKIQPKSTYIKEATGPFTGASLLFGVTNKNDLEGCVERLDNKLNFQFGMQIIEDALCNWQKSPGLYKYFGG